MRANTFVLISAPIFFGALPVRAADAVPDGGWRTTNNCFLAAFNLAEGGRAETRYLSGEMDDGAQWHLEDGKLTITSEVFPMDSFEGEITGDRIEAEFVWHDLDLDQLHPQNCTFERFRRAGA